jgi:hypothetical protein
MVVEFNTVALPMIGELGFVVTELVAPDAMDVPPEFTAITVNVYAVFAVNPDTVIGDVIFVPVDVIDPGLLVTI